MNRKVFVILGLSGWSLIACNELSSVGNALGLTQEEESDQVPLAAALLLASSTGSSSNCSSIGNIASPLSTGGNVTVSADFSVGSSTYQAFVPIHGTNGKTVTITDGQAAGAYIYVWDGVTTSFNSCSGSSGTLASNENQGSSNTLVSSFNFTADGPVIARLFATPTPKTVTISMN